MLIEILISIFLGFIIGRLGDYLAGHWNFFHHWVYGVILIIFGIIYRTNYVFLYFGGFGLGLLVSDFEDLLAFRIYGPDKKKTKRFWSFD